MKTKFGKVFVRREITETSESIAVRADHPLRFRYRNMAIQLTPNEENVFYFKK